MNDSQLQTMQETMHVLVGAHLGQGGPVCMRVLSSSMWPWIRPDDLVSVKAVRVEELRPGDVVVFRKDGDLLVHRFLGKAKTAGGVVLATKGDNAFVVDSGVTAAALVGKVYAVRRGKRSSNLHSLGWRCAGYILCFFSSLQALVYQLLRRVKHALAGGGR